MFNRDFYPTPESVADLMGIDCFGKVVLEPQAGKGNLIEYAQRNGAKEVLCCEKNKDLAQIAMSKGKFITYDFLAVVPEQIGHVEMILMNPPFSNAAEHIIHAWEICPEGCEIISLCNFDSLERAWRDKYSQVQKLLNIYGYSQNLGAVFSQEAERETSVNIGLIKLYKPVVSEKSNFEGFYMEDDEEFGEYGIMGASEVQRLVAQYRGALMSVDAVFDAGSRLNVFTNNFGLGAVSINMGRDSNGERVAMNKTTFAVQLQQTAWRKIFLMMNMEKYVSSQVMKDINTFCQNQQNVPFTVRNIRKMFEIIMGTQDQIFDRSLVEAVDNFTKYTDDNRFGLPGWKTNAGHLLNQKFIVDWIVKEREYGDRAGSMELRTGYRREYLEDLVKVLCRLTGANYDDFQNLWNFFSEITVERGKWHSWAFFEIKCYKKGTMHLKFQRKEDWEALNRRYAKIKGQVLPEKI